jgi:hypothetical protein
VNCGASSLTRLSLPAAGGQRWAEPGVALPRQTCMTYGCGADEQLACEGERRAPGTAEDLRPRQHTRRHRVPRPRGSAGAGTHWTRRMDGRGAEVRCAIQCQKSSSAHQSFARATRVGDTDSKTEVTIHGWSRKASTAAWSSTGSLQRSTLLPSSGLASAHPTAPAAPTAPTQLTAYCERTPAEVAADCGERISSDVLQ